MSAHIPFANRTLGEILTDIRALSTSSRAQGTYFERLFLEAAPRIPELEIKQIQAWADWASETPGRGGQDTGIDLVAETNAGNTVAIQCKCYAADYEVRQKDITEFIAAANPQTFDLLWFVATCDYNKNAKQRIAERNIRVIDFLQYENLVLTTEPKPPREPWPLQQEAIDAVIKGFDETGHDRGRLIMACGTGKTFTALRIAEQLTAKNTLNPRHANILFIAPSIALVAQNRREWLNHTRRPLACTVICSDQTAGRNSEDIGTTEISCETTTDPARIAAALNGDIPAGTARAVFCTYQSLDKLAAAQAKYGAPAFDLALIDEAHRTTGYLDETRGAFRLIHDRQKIRANKRLYMTATPRIYQAAKGNAKNHDEHARIVDMNDVKTYGNEFHRLGFKKAVEAGMLCDYRVIALGITEDCMDENLKDILLKLNEDIGGVGKAADAQAFLALGAIALAVNGIVQGKNTPGVLARTIAYASNIRRSKWLARALQENELGKWVSGAGPNNNGNHTGRIRIIDTKHLDGTSTALQRNTALRDLNSAATEERPHLISNARLFTEGVDVPALNAIAFLDPRQSKVDTIQAVGRVMRRDDASGKALGYIVVPVILPPGMELLEVLAEQQSRFKSLGNVLRALQSHDERLYTELTDRLTFGTINRDRPDNDRPPSEDYEPVQASLLDEHAKQAIYAQIAAKTGISQQGRIIADAITQSIERAARLFKQEGATGIIADTIGTPSDNEDESCKTAALLIANACIMHKRLEETGNLGGLTKIEFATLTRDPASALAGAWFTILKKDYGPVFQDATALLENLPRNDAINSAIGTLIQCAIDNATTLNELGFDHAGPLYHSVLGSAQSDGAYYTKNLSGYLLAGLAFDEHFTDWSDPETVGNLKIIDPACGTGTLLMAALNIIKKRAAKAQNLDEKGVNQLHKKLVENALYGLDINKYSVQLAACNLTIGAPNTDYERMNLHTLVHGPKSGTDGGKPDHVRHGILEKLLDLDMNQMVQEPPPLFGKGVTRRETSEVVMPKEFDAVIYNPPFTKSEKQAGKYSKSTQDAMRSRLQSIKFYLEMNALEAAKAIVVGGIRPFFTPLATGLLSKSKGKLAKIIPATACTSEKGKAERQYIADNFHVEMVVTSHDPKRINFSENTNIHECLVIGRRNANNDQPTRFIQLVAYPNNVKDTEALIDAIQNRDSGKRYTETLWPADKMRAGDWTPVQWMNSELVNVAGEIKKYANLATACKYRWSSTTQTLPEIFHREEVKDGNQNGNVFCTINEGVMQTITTLPTHIATPKSGHELRAKKSWMDADHALVAVKYSTTSTRITAVYSETPALGNMYRPIGVKDRELAKAYVAFMNSSFGAIQLLNLRSTKLTFSTYTPSQMRTLMLPDPNKADLTPLLDAFEQVKDTPLERLANCATDPARKILDHAAARAIGMPPATTDQWRRWLSEEPTITNQPYQPAPPATTQQVAA